MLFREMLDLRGCDKVRFTKVFKGHADGGMVLDGRVRELDRLGNNPADEAADFGRRESVLLLSMLVVISLGYVVDGILSFLIFIGSS